MTGLIIRSYLALAEPGSLRLREHPALPEILRLDRHQRFEIGFGVGNKTTIGLPEPRAIDGVSDRARVGEMRLAAADRNSVV